MERRARWMTLSAALVLAIAGITPALANPESIEKARRLLVENNPKQAYMELIKFEGQLAGNIDYDYLLGVAALDSGKIDDAIVAFERVLAVNPNHAGAQMDIARAYFVAGSFDLAEAGFRSLAASNPPPIAQQTINRYLEAIQARKRQTTPGWSRLGQSWVWATTTTSRACPRTSASRDFDSGDLRAGRRLHRPGARQRLHPP